MFEPLINFMHDKKKEGSIPLWKRMIAGGASGAMGAVACNPFELVKTRMQSHANSATNEVGFQHRYTGTFQGLASIVKSEGFFALYKGSGMSVIRSTLGSGCNMALYTGLRDYLIDNEILANNAATDAFSGLVSSFFCALVMNPIDVARTRLYNQPKDQYKNGVDVMVQLIRNEGLSAFMKGFLPSFARLGPHFTYVQNPTILSLFGGLERLFKFWGFFSTFSILQNANLLSLLLSPFFISHPLYFCILPSSIDSNLSLFPFLLSFVVSPSSFMNK